jgi:class 3 adenylate cyclase
VSIKVLRLHHHSPHVGGTRRDAAELRDFYTSVLGFAADPDDPAAFHAPGYCLRLGEADASRVSATLDVADIETARIELERLGVRYRTVPLAQGAGPVALRVTDPAGNDIELRQYEGPRAAAVAGAPLAQPSGYRKMRGAVMFADMRGFTSVSERLSPAEVVPLLNEYCELLTGIAVGHGGTVFNMAGDGLMIGFGVPREQPDAPRRAVITAREMLAGFRLLAADWKRRHGVETGLGIGINAGEVIAGRVGSAAFTSYTIVGDTVNVAARLSQRARAGEALLSYEVRRHVDFDPVETPVIELPALKLRGRAAPVSIYCLPAAERLDFRTL